MAAISKIKTRVFVANSSLALLFFCRPLLASNSELSITPPERATKLTRQLSSDVCARGVLDQSYYHSSLLQPATYSRFNIFHKKLSGWVKNHGIEVGDFLDDKQKPRLDFDGHPKSHPMESSWPEPHRASRKTYTLNYLACLLSLGYKIGGSEAASFSVEVGESLRISNNSLGDTSRGDYKNDSLLEMIKQYWQVAHVYRNGREILLAGDYGIVAVSRNLGESWDIFRVPTGRNLLDVHLFEDGKSIIAGDFDGAIFYSDDYGSTWARAKIADFEVIPNQFKWTTRQASRFFFIDRLRGWLTTGLNNGQILKTVDGGKTWSLSRQGDRAEQLAGVWFDRSGKKGWVGGSTHYGFFGNTFLLSTRDGGATWRMKEFPGQKGRINSIQFDPSGKNGWAASAGGVIFTTRDGGDNWAEVRIGKKGEEPFITNAFLSESGASGCAVGKGAFVLSEGSSTQTIKPRLLPFEGVGFSPDGRIAVGGGFHGADISTDFCQTWRKVTFSVP